MAANTISRLGRSTQGVTLMNLNPGDAVAALSVEPAQDDEANPNVLSMVEATTATDASADGRANGSTSKAK